MGNSCFAYAKKSDLSVVAQYIKAIEQHNVDSIKDMIESNPIEGKDNIDYILSSAKFHAAHNQVNYSRIRFRKICGKMLLKKKW